MNDPNVKAKSPNPVDLSGLNIGTSQPGLSAILEKERVLIAARRSVARDNREGPQPEVVGIALSGGGIRSATFCLGLFQGLARYGLVRQLDYLSTVSGGGYFGSFFGRMFTRRWACDPANSPARQVATSQPAANSLRGRRPQIASDFIRAIENPKACAADRVEAVLKDSTSPPVQWLRESGNYLTPGGSGDAALAAAVFTRNWLAVLVVMLVTLLTVFLGGNLLRAVLNSWGTFDLPNSWHSALRLPDSLRSFHDYELWLQSLTTEHWWWTPWFFLPWLVMALVVAPVAWAYWLTQAGEDRQFACVAGANVLVIGFGVLAWKLLPETRFCLGAIALGVEALLALAWIWIMGAVRCWRSPLARKLLPDKRLVISILLVSFLPGVWEVLVDLQPHSDPKPWAATWITAALLFLVGLHHLALRAAVEHPPHKHPRSWLGCWNLSHWGTNWPGMSCWMALACLLPLILTAWRGWQVLGDFAYNLLDIWAVLAVLAAPYFLAYQVLRADARFQPKGTDTKKPELTSWLRSKLSRFVKTGLVAFVALQLLVFINTLGQSIYATLTYAGGTKPLATLLTGLVGITGLAPLIRFLALKSFGVKEGFRVPLKILALIGALILVLLMALTFSCLAHGIAWRWGCPKLVKEINPTNGPVRLSVDQITDPASLLQKLRAGGDPVSKFLQDQVSREAGWILTDTNASLACLTPVLVEQLNNVLQTNSFYDSNRFAGVALSQATSNRFPLKPADANVIWFNRLLLQDAYPAEIAETQQGFRLRGRIAWEWGIRGQPHATNGPGASALSPVGDAPTPPPSALANSPGARIYARYVAPRDVALTAKSLIQVLPPPATIQPNLKQTHMFILDLGLSFVAGLALTMFFGHTISFLNLSSFHSFYTFRLIRAYQGATNEARWRWDASIDETDGMDDIAWHDYHPHEKGGPLHLVNVAVNCTVSLETNKQSTTAKGLNLCLGPVGLSFGHRHALSGQPHEKDKNVLPGSRVCFADAIPQSPSNPSNAERSADASSARPPAQDSGAPPHPVPTQPASHACHGLPALEPGFRFVPRIIEPLSLGDWVGISGAAFTTGLGNVGGGAGTAIGTSLLCGLFNVRLGYWWSNNFSPSTGSSGDRYLPMQTYLLDEMTGSFHLEKRDRWYLSDGGHFENTAAYELIRRRVPFIIVSDAGADPAGEFSDIANLVRRVRIDFGAEIEFFSDEELTKKVHPKLLAPCVVWRTAHPSSTQAQPEEIFAKAGCIGALADLHPWPAGQDGPKRVGAHATLAWVKYPPDLEQESAWSLLLLIKPGLTDDLPADLLNYQCTEPDFPHQTTLDQFFDEAQWESYRRLGESLADLLFVKQPNADGGNWTPNQMHR